MDMIMTEERREAVEKFKAALSGDLETPLPEDLPEEEMESWIRHRLEIKALLQYDPDLTTVILTDEDMQRDTEEQENGEKKAEEILEDILRKRITDRRWAEIIVGTIREQSETILEMLVYTGKIREILDSRLKEFQELNEKIIEQTIQREKIDEVDDWIRNYQMREQARYQAEEIEIHEVLLRSVV